MTIRFSDIRVISDLDESSIGRVVGIQVRLE